MTFPIRTHGLLPIFTLAACTLGHAQVDFTTTYEQDFDHLKRTRGILAGSWKSGFQIPLEILPGWQITRTGPDFRGDLILREVPADLIVGRISSFAAQSEEDRAFGQISTEESTAAFGLSLKNTSGHTIKRVKIAYATEVWRSPSGTPGPLSFAYGTSASGISEKNYLSSKGMKSQADLDGAVPKTVTAGDTLNGNATENRTVVSGVIENLDWKAGETLFLRWTPSETLSNGIAIDDLVISADEVEKPGFTSRYEQDFNILTPTVRASLRGTGNVNQQQAIPMLPNWQAARIGGAGSGNLGVEQSDGGDGSGKLYSFGQAGAEDRALGAVSTQNTSLAFGTSFTNTSDRTFTKVKVKYTAELWRTPGTVIDKMVFSYGPSTGGITEENYLTHPAMTRQDQLDAAVPTTSTSNSAIDGNAPENKAEIAGVIEGLQWKPGDTLFIAWTLENGRGTGSGIGIDDLELIAE